MRKHFFLFSLFILAGGLVQAQSICAGSNVTLQAQNPAGLTNVSYSLMPGGFQNTSGQFIFAPPGTPPVQSYTLYTSGKKGTPPKDTTTTAVVQVTVNPQPIITPTVSNFSCSSPTNCWNLNLTFNPASPAPSFTITWAAANPTTTPNVPPTWSNNATSQCGTISPSSYTPIVTAQGGCSTTAVFSLTPPPPQPIYSLSPAPNYSLTCLIPSINIAASNPTLTYSFESANTGIINSPSVTVTFSNVGTWTITAVHPVSGCTVESTFSVGTNTVAPVSILTPTFQFLNCANSPTNIEVTAISPTVNFTHYIYSPIPTIWIAKTPTAAYQPGPGTYTYCLVNDDSGCSTCKQFTVDGNNTFPTFELQSTPAGYTLGCSSKSCMTITYLNADTHPQTGGAVSYTLLPPTFTAVLNPSVVLSTNQTYQLCSPGSYTAVVRDNSNFCTTRIPFSVITNTLPPSIDSVIRPRTILDCDHVSTVIEGFSHTDGVEYTWSFPLQSGGIGNLTSKPYTVQINTFVPNTTTLIANYTLTVQELNNQCISRTVVPMYQNLFPPRAFASAGSPSITCATKSIVLTNFSTSNIPPNSIFPTGQVVEAILWQGPSPQVDLQNSSTYTAMIAGQYTMTVRDRNNGCISSTLVSVGDNQEFPIVTNSYSAFAMECGMTSATLIPIYFNAAAPMSYTWTSPPQATIQPNDNSDIITANKIGTYTLTVMNNLSRCVTKDSMRVVNDSITASISTSTLTGFAPLEVEFFNNTLTSTGGNSSITTIWSFGIDRVDTTYEASESRKVLYTQPGTYTIVAYPHRGLCIDTAYVILRVESPSALKVPNVFTPNDDGVNDLFFLQRAAKLTEIVAKIYDRWGNVVYELTSNTGNIEWDGMNQYGKESPAGTYYYVITATGADGTAYDEKGTISLIR